MDLRFDISPSRLCVYAVNKSAATVSQNSDSAAPSPKYAPRALQMEYQFPFPLFLGRPEITLGFPRMVNPIASHRSRVLFRVGCIGTGRELQPRSTIKSTKALHFISEIIWPQNSLIFPTHPP
jgi:hypothetical protein